MAVVVHIFASIVSHRMEHGRWGVPFDVCSFFGVSQNISAPGVCVCVHTRACVRARVCVCVCWKGENSE